MSLDNKRPFPQRPRLKSFDYKGPYRYFITISTCDRKPIFESKDAVSIVNEIAYEYATKARFNILAFCFMPDHLHLLVEGDAQDSNLTSFISRFKQGSSFYYKQKYGVALWQSSYYDHVLRSEENSHSVAEYILNNPVRKGLVEIFADYPYSSSVWHKPFSLD